MIFGKSANYYNLGKQSPLTIHFSLRLTDFLHTLFLLSLYHCLSHPLRKEGWKLKRFQDLVNL